MLARDIAEHYGFTLTALRADILDVLIQQPKPLKAYDILAEIRKIRKNAEPATVYRVLDFLIAQGALHQLSSQHTFMLCDLTDATDAEHHHQHLLMLCEDCHDVVEVANPVMQALLDEIAAEHNFSVAMDAIELTGICQQCQAH